MAERRRRSLVYETAFEHIKGDLITGHLQAGDRLPTVRDLARQLELSPAAVREAYRVLESLGYLEVTQGRGTFVSALPSDGDGGMRGFQLAERESLGHLFEARSVLEPRLAALAAERASTAEAEAIVVTAQEQSRLHAAGRDFLEPDIRFHELIVLAAHNPVIGRMVSAVNELLLESRRRTMRIPGAAEKAVNYHLLVARAIRDRHPDQARGLMEHHVWDVAHDATEAQRGLGMQTRERGAPNHRRMSPGRRTPA